MAQMKMLLYYFPKFTYIYVNPVAKINRIKLEV